MRKGQSILEYMVILAVIVAAVIAGAHFIRTGTQDGLSDASSAMQRSTSGFSNRIGQ